MAKGRQQRLKGFIRKKINAAHADIRFLNNFAEECFSDVMLEIAALAAEYAIPLRVYADIEHMRRGLEDEELGRKVKDDLLNMQVYPFCGMQ